MADVFISYAHEDKSFARMMTAALEAEGFSVWWDHTIPPGKTWHTYIARGLEEAKACITVWSAHSVNSKWVLEEASLAADAEKLLPVQIGAATPPMGFRRLQAAQLSGWRGDGADPQFRLLVTEVQTLIGDSMRMQGNATPAVPPQPNHGGSQRNVWVVGGLVFAAVVGAVVWIGTTLANRAPEPQLDAATETTAPEVSASAPTDSRAGIARPVVTTATSEHDIVEAAGVAPTAPPAADWTDIPGRWRVTSGPCLDLLIAIDGTTITTTTGENGTHESWFAVSGANAIDLGGFRSVRYAISADSQTLTWDGGPCTWIRQ